MAIYSEIVKLLQMIDNWQQTDEQKYRELCRRIELSVTHAQHSNVNDFYRIIHLEYDKLLTLPVKLVFLVFKKANQLNPNDRELLLSFSAYLFCHGPQWDREAEQIRHLVEEGKMEACCEIAQRITWNDEYYGSRDGNEL
ncbi:hypothetical protein [Polycladomyces subterraneus]|uniref:Uncharacterized protein n=1 Tax=Polycladomyces subterraneus TaxID=1016997 RepID=A0ABT8ILQ3_9BACL|nr:hypothetical protein [Polycladomyces subterraneus]MDN4593667.1 hypothetical protein [Polycladomyces subterraneus]